MYNFLFLKFKVPHATCHFGQVEYYLIFILVEIIFIIQYSDDQVLNLTDEWSTNHWIIFPAIRM